MAIVQAFNRERQFQGQFDELNGENRDSNVYAQKLFSVFFPSIELLGAISTCAVLVVGSRVPARRGHAHDRHADHGHLPAAARVPAAAGALGRVRPAPGGGRGDGQDQHGARHRAGDRRSPRRAADRRAIEGRIDLDARQLRLRRDRRAARHRHPRAGRRLHRPGRPDRRRQVDARQADRPLLRPARRHRAGRRHRPARGASCAATAASSASCCRTRSCSRARSPTTSASPGPTRPTRPGARDRRGDRRSTGCVGRLHGGLDHEVREGGAGLSAGERQLISIARALLADPRILILDEATSNIDRPTEVLIERALDRLLHGRSSIIIAHRLATVRRADDGARGRSRPDRPARHARRAACRRRARSERLAGSRDLPQARPKPRDTSRPTASFG